MDLHYIAIAILKISLFHLITSTPLRHSPANNQLPPSIPNSINSLEEDHVHRALGDVAATIAEVQKILATDPTLPRLTTGEIEELFENVTREEMEKSLRNGDHDRARHMKALMLVLPYNTHNISDARLQELYTRPPITKVINPEVKPPTPQKVVVLSENRANKITNDNQIYQKPTTFHPRPSSTTTKLPLAQDISATATPQKLERFSSHYSAERPPFPKIQQRPPIRENVKDLLATIGLTQEVIPTTTRKPELTPEIQKLLESFGLLTNEEPPKHLQFDINPIQEEFKPIQNSQSNSPAAEVHSTGFKRSSFRMNTAPELTPDDFYAFKPLPNKKVADVNGEMQDFLKRFGLVDTNARGQKSIKSDQPTSTATSTTTTTTTTQKPKPIEIMEKMPEVRVDFLTPELINVLGNIGIQNRAFDTDEKTQSDERISRKLTNLTNEEDRKQLNLLLDTIQELQKLNANLSDDEWNKLYNQLVAPNPVDSLENEEVAKNEVKRQSGETTTENSSPIRITLDLKATTEENSEINPTEATAAVAAALANDDSLNALSEVGIRNADDNGISSTAESTTTTTTTTTATSDDLRNNSNLDDTFSGDLDPVTETPLPAPRRNGFYFLADWNSFLEVGEEPDKVVVRFDPKIGDPSRFIPVHIP